MTPKDFIMPQNIQKVVLSNIILQKRDITVRPILFPGRSGGHFEFALYRSPKVTPILFAMDFENTHTAHTQHHAKF